MEAVNLTRKLALFTKQWHPHLIAEGRDLQVFLSKLQGEFVMHSHDNGDELFYVVTGRMEMCFKTSTVEVREGEIILVPRAVEHCPRTRPDEEAEVLVVELLGTAHTGAVKHERTVETYERI